MGRRRVLVVGAGLTGACLAWLCATRGDDVVLLSSDRPASQATALAAGLVRGVGPPGGLRVWESLSDDAIRLAYERTARGFDLLSGVVLAARRPTGYYRCPHVLLPGSGVGDTDLGQAAARLRAQGYAVDCREHLGDVALYTRRDALVHPRRLTFEMLARARQAGARIHLSMVCMALEPGSPGTGRVVARTSHGVIRVDRVFWAAGRPLPGQETPRGTRTRIVLHQTLGPGSVPLDEMLEAAEGDVLMVPHPAGGGLTLLSRVAEETAAGGLQWPDPPPAWDAYRGPAIRQLLSEAVVGPAIPDWTGNGAVVSLVGFSGWPIAMLVGTCAEAVESSSGATPRPI